MSFLTAASRQVTDVKEFLRSAAGSNSLKYRSEAGARHQIYIPYQEVDIVDDAGNHVIQKRIIALQAKVHEWTGSDNKPKTCICLKDVVRKDDSGNELNNGECPFCNRVSDAWDIYRYRKQLEDAQCTLTGDAREKHLKKIGESLRDERKVKEARDYMYMLIVLFKTQKDGTPILGSDHLPEYELKVMRMSAYAAESVNTQFDTAGAEMANGEFIVSYPNIEDPMLRASKKTNSPVLTERRITTLYPGVVERINKDIEKFQWDGLEKAFPEWAGMTTAAAEESMNNSFKNWDNYIEERKVNPAAQYLEYLGSSSTSNPEISSRATTPQATGFGIPMPGVDPFAGATAMNPMTGAAGIPMPGVVAQNATPQAPQMPNGQVAPTAPQMPNGQAPQMPGGQAAPTAPQMPGGQAAGFGQIMEDLPVM